MHLGIGNETIGLGGGNQEQGTAIRRGYTRLLICIKKNQGFFHIGSIGPGNRIENHQCLSLKNLKQDYGKTRGGINFETAA
ncbi:MAG: hypothetical protein EOO05_17710 [Chitinophagaceae bacterium]|nr:MAG: hypothetical protein EOO05_17710 [Chitinophagaceae bacterium]